MKLSTRCRYGTRAMVEIARNYGNGPTKRRMIAEAQDISEGYLENILSTLKAQDFVVTLRGAEGGFALKRPPAEIVLIDIVNALEGSICPVECVVRPGVCNKADRCMARKVWIKLYQAQLETLSQITLQDMLDMEEDTGEEEGTADEKEKQEQKPEETESKEKE